MHVGPIIAVTDLARAKDFYQDVLGLRGEPTPDGGWIVHADAGTVLYLLPGVADAGSASWPVASFRVDDLRSTVRSLVGRGMSFADDVPFDLDEDNIAASGEMKVAWFRDPDGSMMTFFERTAADQS